MKSSTPCYSCRKREFTIKMSLPAPDVAALAHSHAVASRVIQEIDRAGGWISFSRYMEIALYEPGLGYYSAGAAKFGAAGDFTTAPEISALFGRTLARFLTGQLHDGAPDLLELGAGSGKLAIDVLTELAALGKTPRSYAILEPSATLRARQFDALAAAVPDMLPRVTWLDTLPSRFNGVIFGNEVLDALPVEIVHWCPDRTMQRGVRHEGERLVWQEQAVPDGLLRIQANIIRDHLGGALERADYISEIGLAAQALVRTLAETLAEGALIFIDYGFDRAQFYHAQRSRGTLMCHYRHHAHNDPFFLPGLQDITAHVDFGALDEVAIDCGLSQIVNQTQARFLLANGIIELLAETDVNDVARYLPLANQVSRLTSPAEMGELFKVVAWRR